MGSDYSWGVGYGIGTHLTKTDQFTTQLELMSYHINEGKAWTNVYNDLQQAKVIFTKKLSDHLGIFAGPSINLLITNNRDNHGQLFESNFAPYTMASHFGKNTTLRGWFGITAGIHID